MNVIVEQLRLLRGAAAVAASTAEKQSASLDGGDAAAAGEVLMAIQSDLDRIEEVIAVASGKNLLIESDFDEPVVGKDEGGRMKDEGFDPPVFFCEHVKSRVLPHGGLNVMVLPALLASLPAFLHDDGQWAVRASIFGIFTASFVISVLVVLLLDYVLFPKGKGRKDEGGRMKDEVGRACPCCDQRYDGRSCEVCGVARSEPARRARS